MRLYTANIVDFMAVQVIEQVERMQFREVTGSSKQTLYIANHQADYANSMKALAYIGLRPLTYQEAFANFRQLIEKIPENWFHLMGQGIEKSGIYTFNDKGKLVASTGNETKNQKVRVYPGNQPLSLVVNSDYGTEKSGWRFGLNADGSPFSVASVVVGVKLQAKPSQAGLLDAANALRQLQKAVANVKRSLGPAEEVVSRIAEAVELEVGIGKKDVQMLQALVRDAKKLGETS